MGILLLIVKQERCSDLLLWSAAWLLPPLRLMPMLMPTTATATALATEDSATLDSDMPVLDMEATATPVLATLTARGLLMPSPRLTPSTELTDTELTPTLLATATPPLPLPPLLSLPLLLPSLPPPLLPPPSLPPLLPLLLPRP